MTAAVITEANGIEFVVPQVREEFADCDVELRLRWLPVGTDSEDLTAFDTGVQDGAGDFRNPGGTVDLLFATVNFLFIRVRAYDDALPASGTVNVILTDFLHAGGVNSLNSNAVEAGSVLLIQQANPYTILSTSAIGLVSTSAVNIAVDVLIGGIAPPPP